MLVLILSQACHTDSGQILLQALSRVASTGAMTFCFIQAIERGQAQSYGSVLNAMRDAIRSTNVNSGMGAGPVTSLLEMLVSGGSITPISSGLTQVHNLFRNKL